MYNKYLPYQYYRSEKHFPPPKQIIPPPLKPHQTQKKKFDFKSLKKEAFSSLNDIECFLNNFCSTLKYIKLINLLK